jgi:hypothetical protein
LQGEIPKLPSFDHAQSKNELMLEDGKRSHLVLQANIRSGIFSVLFSTVSVFVKEAPAFFGAGIELVYNSFHWPPLRKPKF